MLYKLIKKHRGKETVVMTDELKLVNDKQKQLLASQRNGVKGQRVEYSVVEAPPDTEKYEKLPADTYKSGQRRVHPRVPKK